MENKVFVERLKSSMSMQGISASELSRRTEINKSAICRYLKGTISPKQGNIIVLAKVLHVDPVWLMGYDHQENTNIDFTTATELETRVRELMTTKFGSVNNFANVCGIPQTTIFTILDRGLFNATFSNVAKMCQTLNISVDRLLCGEVVSNDDLFFEVAVSKLTKTNSVKFKAYYQGLLDAQKD